MIRNDGGVELSNATPAQVSTTGAAGTAAVAARSDHVHAHGNQTDPNLHALADVDNAGFMSSSDWATLNAITGTNTGDEVVRGPTLKFMNNPVTGRPGIGGVQRGANITTFEGINTASVGTSSGTVAANSDSTRYYNKYTTGAVSGNVAYFSWNGFSNFQYGPIFYTTVKTEATITNVRFWVGFTPSTGIAANTLTAGTPGAALRFSTSASDTKWQLVTTDATGGHAAVVTDTGVTVSSSTAYKIVIDCSVSGHVYCYINGSLVADVTSGTIPTSLNAGTSPTIYVETLENVAKAININSIFFDRNN